MQGDKEPECPVASGVVLATMPSQEQRAGALIDVEEVGAGVVTDGAARHVEGEDRLRACTEEEPGKVRAGRLGDGALKDAVQIDRRARRSVWAVGEFLHLLRGVSCGGDRRDAREGGFKGRGPGKVEAGERPKALGGWSAMAKKGFAGVGQEARTGSRCG